MAKLDRFLVAHSKSIDSFRRIFRYLAFIILALTTSSCVTVPPQIHSVIENGGLITGVSNQVQMIRAGVSNSVAPRTELLPGDEVITGPGSQAVLLLENGAVEVVVLENTRVIISSIFVDIGEVIVRVKRKLQGVFEVQSEYGVAGVEGTEFLVRMGQNGQYRCVVLDGSVRVNINRPNNLQSSRFTLGAKDELTGSQGRTPQQRMLSIQEYNSYVQRVNDIERIYRPRAMQLLVPDVSGMMESQARIVLRKQNISVGSIDGKITGKARVGQVLGQNPRAGQRVKPNSSIRLTIEVEATTVPNLVGSSFRSAERTLGNSRLNIGRISEEITGNYRVGTVIKQTPTAGQRLPVQSNVDLWLEAESIRIPRLVNNHIDSANRTLNSIGLRLGRLNGELREGVSDGIVLRQSIPPNTLVKPNTTINLVVSEHGVRVPNLMNSDGRRANTNLSNSGLRLGRLSRELREGVPDGTVLRQSIPANKLVKPNTALDLVVAERGVRVPNLVNNTERSVRRILSDHGITLGRVSRQPSQSKEGTVINQRPRSGKLVRPGSSVDITVAQGCRVPNVNQSNTQAAFSKIRNANLNPQIRNQGEYSRDIVFGQSPNVGSSVRCGSTVYLDVGHNLG